MENNEFYIGWQPRSPDGVSDFIRKLIIVLAVLVVLSGTLLSWFQKRFASGTFEYGKLTEIKGTYFSQPVPLLRVVNGKDIWGNETTITIPLVGFGKFGAEGIIAELEKEKTVSLNGKQIRLRGTLLYNDGKLLMQLDANDKPLMAVEGNALHKLDIKELGNQTLKGEIVDPKCFFGVMKPGEGKVHKDCAIRCILGGIPPVLKVKNREGVENYYLVVGPHGEKMNEAIKDFIAEPVSIAARLVKQDDWVILYVDSKNIQRISGRELVYPSTATLACSSNCEK